MILVFGGTTEGKQVISLLNELQRPFLYSTKTKIDETVGGFGRYIHGALDEKGMKALLHREGVRLIIDAAHPFAAALHLTVAVLSRAAGIPLIRYERERPEPWRHPLVHYVSSYEEAITCLKKWGCPRLLALSGVQSIPLLASYWKNHETYFRILDRPESESLAESHHFPKERLIRGYPSETVLEEIRLIALKDIGALLTKESGESGRQGVKIEAAIASQVPILILTRPEPPESDHRVKDREQLKQLFTKRMLG